MVPHSTFIFNMTIRPMKMSRIFYESEALGSGLGFALVFRKPATAQWVSTTDQHWARLDWEAAESCDETPISCEACGHRYPSVTQLTFEPTH